MTKTDPRAAASLALRDATAVYNAAVAEATQAEDAHAQAEYRFAARYGNFDAALADVERTATALRVANAVVATALAERHRLYNIYLDLSAASKA